MGETTTTTHAAYIPEVWGAKVFEYAYEDAFMPDLVSTFDAEVAGFGDIVHIPVMGSLSVTTKAADTAVTFTANTDTDKTVTVDVYEYIAVAITLQVQKQAKYDLAGLNQRAMAKAIANRWDAQILATYSGFSQSVGTAGAGLTDASLIESVALLDVANAPEGGRSLVLHPKGWADMIGIDKFYNSATFPQQKALAKYQIAEIYGVKTYKSNNVTTSGNTEYNLMLHKEALGFARSIGVDVMIDDVASHLRKEIVAGTLYGIDELRDTFGVQVLS